MSVTGQVVWEAYYASFGEAQSAGMIENPLRFPGQYYDSETGMHYNYFRYYETEIGRYVSADPLEIPNSINLYQYSQSNPVKYIDPLGLSHCYRGYSHAEADPRHCQKNNMVEEQTCKIGECRAGIKPPPDKSNAYNNADKSKFTICVIKKLVVSEAISRSATMLAGSLSSMDRHRVIIRSDGTGRVIPPSPNIAKGAKIASRTIPAASAVVTIISLEQIENECLQETQKKSETCPFSDH